MESNEPAGAVSPAPRPVTTLRAKFVGTLLGGMVADGFGAPMQGWSAERVASALEFMAKLPPDSAYRALCESVVGPHSGRLTTSRYHYTDDTQMSIAVTESLIASERFDGANLARHLTENFDAGRGYGPGIYCVLQQLKRGTPWNVVGQQVFGGQGSHCNGGASRVAPVALLYHDRDAANLRRVVEMATAITHAHPTGMEGAVIQAQAIAVALRLDPERELSPSGFLDAVEGATASKISCAQKMFQSVRALVARDASPLEVRSALGCDCDAINSVGIALCAFLIHPFQFEKAVLFAIRVGGNTDTFAALTGAIAGAFLGHAPLPQHWIHAIENDTKGRDYYGKLALELYEVWRTSQKRHVPVK